MDMKKHAAVALVALTSYACLATAAAVWLGLERRSGEKLLAKLALAKPGVRVSVISSQLGPLMGEYSSEDDVFAWGTVKDESFCQGKKLLRFYASTPPCRAMDVYTDADGVIVYATWTGL